MSRRISLRWMGGDYYPYVNLGRFFSRCRSLRMTWFFSIYLNSYKDECDWVEQQLRTKRIKDYLRSRFLAAKSDLAQTRDKSREASHINSCKNKNI